MRQLLIAIVAVVLGAVTVAQAQDAEETWLAVVQGELTAATDGTLTISADAHAVVFTDRPARIARLVTIEHLVDIGWGTEGAFAGDPPNASLIDAGSGDIAIIEMTGVTLTDGTLTITYTLLEGTIPAAGGNVALTIDAFPTAVNGQITDS